MMRTILGALLLPALLPAQPAELYRNLRRLTWVVKDIGPVAAAWEKLGAAGIVDHGAAELPGGGRVRRVSCRLGALAVDWIQPLAGSNPFSDFLARHGDGIFALVYQASTVPEFEAEIERMRGLGVGTLLRGSAGGAEYVFFDTAAQGKYATGIVRSSGPPPEPAGSRRITQVAFVVRDLRPVAAFWKRLGFPEPRVSRPLLRDVIYRGRQVVFEQDLGFQNYAGIAYEWCVVPPGPSIFREYLERHGEGVQHLGTPVADVDEGVRALGFPAAQTGNWGRAGQKGSGRYAYLDLESAGGVSLELLWSLR